MSRSTLLIISSIAVLVAVIAAGLVIWRKARPGLLRRLLWGGVVLGLLAGTAGTVVGVGAKCGWFLPNRGRLLTKIGSTVRLGTVHRQAFTQITNKYGTPILRTDLTGAKSGVTATVWIWLPPQYTDPRYAHYEFPVVELYPGYPGVGYNNWLGSSLHGPEILTDLIDSGKAHPFILVAPELQLAPEAEAECSDVPGKPKMGTWQAQDVRQMVLDNFRVPASRDFWGVMGTSSGGWCAARFALAYPQYFKAAVSIAGYFTSESTYWGDHTAEQTAAAPMTLLRRRPNVRILATAGIDDESGMNEMRWFAAAAAPPTHVETLVGDGRHLTRYMIHQLPDCFAFLTRNLSGPVAAAR